ncbi:MAG: hypothetical protein IKL89_00280, partial [Clostridia bacterium]|nr:hypothetical protein [Clostridia bacterium]
SAGVSVYIYCVRIERTQVRFCQKSQQQKTDSRCCPKMLSVILKNHKITLEAQLYRQKWADFSRIAAEVNDEVNALK